jgi:hypothetical protein
VSKPPGKPSSVVRSLIGNRTVRKVVIKNARQAITYATTTMAAKNAARSGDAGSATPPSSTTSAGKPVAKPASIDSAALTNFMTSVAKPVAEKMATTPMGRSVLEMLNNISGQALGTAPKRSDNPAKAFINKLAGAASANRAGAQTAAPEEAKVKFTPLQPPAPSSEPIKTVKWPPPKSPAATVDANPSGTDSAPK